MSKGKLMNRHNKTWQSAKKQQGLRLHASKQLTLKLYTLKSSTIICLLVFMTLWLSSALFPSSAVAQEQHEQDLFISKAELAQTLAPIALYPDTLLTHILIASTYPIEVIEAERWLSKNSTLSSTQRQKRAENKGWDASVIALLPFPHVMEKLSEDLSWMQKLGNAFLQDEARVLNSIQALRQQADQAGSLASMDNVQVIKEQQTIIIEPAQPTIIYVPYYDSRVVYGRWHWSHYPPVYWHTPHHYVSNYGHFYWGGGVHISTNFFFSAFHWHNRHIVVSHHNRHGYHPRKKIVVSHNAKRWHHQAKHRRGVAYSSGRLRSKYYSTQPRVHNTHNRKKNKSIKHSVKHSVSTRNHGSASREVKRKNSHNNVAHNAKLLSNKQVKHHRSAQSKRRVNNKRNVRSVNQSKQAKVDRHSVPRHSTKIVKSTKHAKRKYH